MSRDLALHRFPMIFTVVIGLVLTLVTLPDWIRFARPNFVVLIVLYWSIMNPRVGGLTLAFFAGLMLDAFNGVILGQHALALCLASAIAIKSHLRMRVVPVLQQAMYVLLLLVIYEFVIFWIDGATGHALTDWRRWITPLAGALLWPVVAGLLGRAYQRT
jgi:rod shape-determining protein MreD